MKNLRSSLICALLFYTLGGNATAQNGNINYYKDLINSYNEKALKYEFPKDARMYEASNTSVEG